MSSFGLALLLLIGIVVVGLQAVTGEIWTRGVRSMSITREQDPEIFWLFIVLQIFLVLVVFVAGICIRPSGGE